MANLQALYGIKFTELLICDVKRLTRPRFNHEFTQFNDPMAFSRLNGEAEPTEMDGDLMGLLGNGGNEVKPQKGIQLMDIEEDYDPSVE